jgi:hypothetical protein
MPLIQKVLSENDVDFRISVEINNSRGGNRIELAEIFVLRECSFTDLAAVMSRFHDLFQSIKREKGGA